MVHAINRRANLWLVLLEARLLLGRVSLGLDLLSPWPGYANKNIFNQPPILGNDLSINIASNWPQSVDMAITGNDLTLGHGLVILVDPACVMA